MKSGRHERNFNDELVERKQFPSHQSLYLQISTYGKTFIIFRSKNLQYRKYLPFTWNELNLRDLKTTCEEKFDKVDMKFDPR